MDSRSGNDNLVNFSAELATTLNQLESKEPLLTFPFDHLYACHSGSVETVQALDLDKEVEIAAHCPLPHQDRNEIQRVASLEKQNKKLKDLLIYHLDLIQQQNDLMSKKEKLFQSLKVENELLKSKESRAGVDRKVSQTQPVPSLAPPAYVPVTSTVTSATCDSAQIPPSQQNFFNTFNELLFHEDSNVAANPFLYLTSDLTRPSETVTDLQSFLSSELGGDILEETPLQIADTYTMIENKRPSPDPKPTTMTKPVPLPAPVPIDVTKEPKYTVTTNSGNPKIQRNRKRPTGIGSFSRMPKTKSTPKPETSTVFEDDIFNVNKQSKTYGKSKLKTSKYAYTTLQERMQLIDPTPTGEDPYQLGEAEMREQSPIPKLMLQKTNHGRMRIRTHTDPAATTTITPTSPTRPIYDTMSTSSRGPTKAKRAKLSDNYSPTSMLTIPSKKEKAKLAMNVDSDLVVGKPDTSIDWQLFNTSKPKEMSVCDFSYGESSANLVNVPLDITKMAFPDFFEPSPVNADSSSATEVVPTPEKPVVEKKKRGGVKTSSLAGPVEEETNSETKRGTESKRGRKRALSTAATVKDGDSTPQKSPAKTRVRRAAPAKTPPVPGMTTLIPYHTSVCHPDVSWYYGIYADIKREDCEAAAEDKFVEVPNWRLKEFTALESVEGAENLDDKVFEKRHHKLEAEERRQLRWHMRRVREQRHVERLRQRQRDPWAPSTSQVNSREEYTVWPQASRDLQFIEITDTLPVTAFGAELPDLPEKNFKLPWVRVSKALKRSKRSKTLH